jgi:hypothetical protein
VLVHTLAGYRDQNEGWQASALREAGFATLAYDSFFARGMGDLVATPMRGPPTRRRSPMRACRGVYPAPIEPVAYADAKHKWTDPGRGAARQ